jgi:uncharacterized protein YcfL
VKNTLVPVIALLTLSGCSTPTVKLLAPEYKVVVPPDNLYNCPQVSNFGITKQLTNQQVGQVILTLQKNNLVCKDSLDNIHKYIDSAKEYIEKKS